MSYAIFGHGFIDICLKINIVVWFHMVLLWQDNFSNGKLWVCEALSTWKPACRAFSQELRNAPDFTRTDFSARLAKQVALNLLSHAQFEWRSMKKPRTMVGRQQFRMFCKQGALEQNIKHVDQDVGGACAWVHIVFGSSHRDSFPEGWLVVPTVFFALCFHGNGKIIPTDLHILGESGCASATNTVIKSAREPPTLRSRCVAVAQDVHLSWIASHGAMSAGALGQVAR